MKTILVDAVGTFVIEGEGVYKPLQDLLEGYLNRKIIVTNADENQKLSYGLVNLPYELFSLSHNPDKTDPEYFRKLLSSYDFTTEDVIYFEHNPKAVESAASLNIISFYYDPEKKDLDGLKKFLDENL